MSKELSLFDAPLRGVSLVEAGAGTGKTYNIASLFVRAILEKKLLPTNILVLTYTEAATAELKTRLRNRIKESISALEGQNFDDEFLQQLSNRFDRSNIEILQKALYQFDEAAVSTIHGFCQRLLKENSILFGVSSQFKILNDDRTLLQEVVDHFWRSFLNDDNTEFKKALILFISLSGYYPDNLLERAKVFIEKPYANLVPESRSLDSFKEEFIQLNNAFKMAREVFRDEEVEIKLILDSDLLNGNRYQNRGRHFEDVKNWFEVNEFPIKPADRLYLFSSYMQGDGKKKGSDVPDLRTFKAIDEYIELAESFSEIEICWLINTCKEIKREFEKVKDEQDLLTYNDLLEKVEKGVHKKNELIIELSKKYPIALIDEFQDTDPIQYSIFKKIYSHNDTAIFMIGDPKQAIYSFRGADIFTYIEAREDADNNQKYSLRNNFRSSKKLIESVNTVFEAYENPFLIDNLPFNPAQYPAVKETSELLFKQGNELMEALQFVEVEVEALTADGVRKNITENVCAEIITLLSGDFTLDEHSILESDIAVLVRTHYQAKEIQNRLRDLGIKSIINSKESVYLSQEASELYLILSAIADPSFEDRIRAALTTEALGLKSEGILKLLESEPHWEEVLQSFLTLNKIWKEKGFLKMSNQLLSEFRIEFNYADYFDAERRITNIYHIFELLDKAERLNNFSINGLKNYLKAKINGESGDSSEEEIVRLESDEKLVQIVTIHASKGLEYPVVFCPYLWEGVSIKDRPIFSFHKDKKAVLDFGSKGEQRYKHRELKLNEELAESVRLLYVALTRAKAACFVFIADGINSEISAFSAIFEGSEIMKQRISDKLNLNPARYKATHKTEKTKLSTLIKAFCIDNTKTFFRKPYDLKTDYSSVSLREQDEFKSLRFSRSDLFEFQKITSFSSLTQIKNQNTDFEEKFGFDYDDLNNITLPKENTDHSIFSLPKGAKTGTLLHEIFEEIHFNDPNTFDDAINNGIHKHGFSEVWTPVLQKLVKQTVNHPLNDEIRLSDLDRTDCLIEMEFHFPVSIIGLNSLINTVRGIHLDIEEHKISGFMKGFIDLIFVRNGKYYILDYKSNFLGDTIGDYNQDSLEEEIHHSNYDLQYHIYVLALHKMLEKSVNGYSYEEHFGGVIYLFLRGIDPLKNYSSVYFDKPDYSVVQALNDSIKSGGNG